MKFDVIAYLNSLPSHSVVIDDAFIMADKLINDDKYSVITCSISGGSDSDIMLDIIHTVDINHKVKYVWFDTGLEYLATKRHLEYLEHRYNISIDRLRAVKSIPYSCKIYGQPFLSKLVSENIERLQKYGFEFKDEPYETLVEKYPNCRSAIDWWCNKRKNAVDDDYSMFDISFHKYLKEFLIENPPTFNISPKCCLWAKKYVSKHIIKRTACDLMIVGIRKAEGGIRATRYKSCFETSSKFKIDFYRPVFWFTAETKIEYESLFNIVHSDCYTKYGFTRTGCACCPFGRHYLDELYTLSVYEPTIYNATVTIFKDSYEYTAKYHKFRKRLKNESKGKVSLF